VVDVRRIADLLRPLASMLDYLAQQVAAERQALMDWLAADIGADRPAPTAVTSR
jgi:hypothetical protein